MTNEDRAETAEERVMEAGDECPNCHCGTLEETDEEFVCRGECGEIWPKECRYCGGNCPNELDDSEFLCDGFAGDIDGLYTEESNNV